MDNQWCIISKIQPKKCYTAKGKTIHNRKHKNIRGYLQPNFDIKWSHGFTSRASNYPCSSCKISLRDYGNQDTVSFKTDDATQTIVETGKVSISSNSFCHFGSTTGLNCLTMISDHILKVNEDWGWVQPNGTINWSSGFTTRMTEDKCKVNSIESSVTKKDDSWNWGNI